MFERLMFEITQAGYMIQLFYSSTKRKYHVALLKSPECFQSDSTTIYGALRTAWDKRVLSNDNDKEGT
jgi:hypothetical protein